MKATELKLFAENFSSAINEIHSLSASEIKELENDIKDTYQKAYNDWVKRGREHFASIHVCNISLGKRYFKSEMVFLFSEGVLSLLSFDEVSLDEFLDNMNENKKLLDIGFEKI